MTWVGWWLIASVSIGALSALGCILIGIIVVSVYPNAGDVRRNRKRFTAPAMVLFVLFGLSIVSLILASIIGGIAALTAT